MKIWHWLRFAIALWGGKFFLFWYCRTGHVRNDKPGMAAMRLYGDFLRYVAKPKLTIVVTGTNGKTTISALIAGVLRKEGKSVSFNDWGPTIMQVWPGACWTRWTSSTALLRTPWWWNWTS